MLGGCGPLLARSVVIAFFAAAGHDPGCDVQVREVEPAGATVWVMGAAINKRIRAEYPDQRQVSERPAHNYPADRPCDL